MVEISKEKVVDFMEETFKEIGICSQDIDYKYHHNAMYKDASSICSIGILSLKDQNTYKITSHSDKVLKTMDDLESHVNGSDNVSLSVVGLDDIYPGEDEYDPSSPIFVDFLISGDIKAKRNSIHYGNEFLSSSIPRDKIRALDIRLLKLIRKNPYDIDIILKNYNYLVDAVNVIIEDNLNIPVRECSSDIYELDIHAIKKYGKIKESN